MRQVSTRPPALGARPTCCRWRPPKRALQAPIARAAPGTAGLPAAPCPRKQRKPENLRPPIQAAGHLAQRQRERDRWRETEPVTYRERSGNAQQPADDTAWTTTDLVLMGAAVVFIVAALAIKHWPL